MSTAEEHLERLNARRRETVPASELVVGVQCGGSDAFSGVTANPSVGFCTDLLVRAGATVMFSETTEVRDGIDQLTSRASSPEIAEQMIAEMAWYDAYLNRGKVDRSANTTPGNKKGGLSNIVEKAMGSIVKSGSSPISGVLSPGEKLRDRGITSGLVYTATPASDFICGTLQLAAGINLHVFTTGRGTPYGLAQVPVIKVATRSDLARRWHDLMDVNAGRIADGSATHRRGGLGTLPPDARRGQRPQEDLGRALEAAQRAGAVQPRAGDLRHDRVPTASHANIRSETDMPASSTPKITELRVIPVAGRDSMLLNLSGAHGPFFTRNLLILTRQRRAHRRRRSARRREDSPDVGRCPRAGRRPADRQPLELLRDAAGQVRRPRQRRARPADLRPAHRDPRRHGHRIGAARPARPAPGSAGCGAARRRPAARRGRDARLPVLHRRPHEDRPAVRHRSGRRQRLVAPAPRSRDDARSGGAPGRSGARALRLQRLQAEGRRACARPKRSKR